MWPPRKRFEIKADILGPGRGMKREVNFLNRKLSWGPEGIQYESDPKHVEMVIQDVGMQDAKPVTTPTSSQEMRELASALDENGEIAEEEYMSEEDATLYRSVGARMNYLALDRSDMQQSCRCVCAHMAKPLRGCRQLIKRASRYLQGRPRCVQTFRFVQRSNRVIAYSDSDWAGCQLKRKSTSGGVLMLGSSVLRSWSSVQATMAMSSGEAELYAMIKAASQLRYLVSIARDFGMNLDGLGSPNAQAWAVALAMYRSSI